MLICHHPERAEIDSALVHGEPLRNIARRSGTTASALCRHRQQHLPLDLVASKRGEELLRADHLVGEIEALIAQGQEILATAEQKGDSRTALLAIREVRRTYELLAKLQGQLPARERAREHQPLFVLPPGTRVGVNQRVLAKRPNHHAHEVWPTHPDLRIAVSLPPCSSTAVASRGSALLPREEVAIGVDGANGRRYCRYNARPVRRGARYALPTPSPRELVPLIAEDQQLLTRFGPSKRQLLELRFLRHSGVVVDLQEG